MACERIGQMLGTQRARVGQPAEWRDVTTETPRRGMGDRERREELSGEGWRVEGAERWRVEGLRRSELAELKLAHAVSTLQRSAAVRAVEKLGRLVRPPPFQC